MTPEQFTSLMQAIDGVSKQILGSTIVIVIMLVVISFRK